MSISGSLMGGYDTNTSMDGCNTSSIITKKNNRSLLNVTTSSKQCSSLNSSIANSVITNASSNVGNNIKGQQQQQLHQQAHLRYNHRPTSNNNYRQPHQLLEKHRLHLNTLWSIWYGILVTLFQGYLVVQGAHRFLSK